MGTRIAAREVTLIEVARRLGVGYRAAYNLVVEGKLSARQVSRKWWVDAADVERLAGERAKEAAAQMRQMLEGKL